MALRGIKRRHKRRKKRQELRQQRKAEKLANKAANQAFKEEHGLGRPVLEGLAGVGDAVGSALGGILGGGAREAVSSNVPIIVAGVAAAAGLFLVLRK